jgi:hypothetical protein
VHSIDCDTAEGYLRETGRLAPGETVRVRRLAGGVSNEVLYVERGDPRLGDFVLKQARPQLRVADPWFCSVERIWREVETLRVCCDALEEAAGGGRAVGDRLSAIGREIEASVPQVLFEDRENYAFAMTAAPPHDVWKQRLLDGQIETPIAAACGRLLAELHAGTWRDDLVAVRLADRSFFDDLRIDPYYRRIAQVYADLQAPIDELIQSLSDHCVCLVHGDYSPKNLLVWGGPPRGLMLVDFEVGHYGDPAFDLGFFLSHLVLKAFRSGARFNEYFGLTEVFWSAYLAGMAVVAANELRTLTARGIRNFAACMLARIDGKSKVEYLTGEALRESIRRCARKLIVEPPLTWDGVRNNVQSFAFQ